MREESDEEADGVAQEAVEGCPPEAAGEAPQEESEESVKAAIEEAAADTETPEDKAETAEADEEHKLTYQDVFNEETEKTPKHTFLKVLAILILILIILEVAAILIRRFAPDSAIGLQIQQIYEMIFSRFL